MKLYADRPVRRMRQVLGDVLLLLWIAVWIKVAQVVRDTTLLLAKPGQQIADAGHGLASKLHDAGAAVGGLPVVGGRARAPFDGATAAAQQIAAAGSSQVDAVHQLAFWLGLSVAAIPILVVLVVYVPLRLRFARAATAGRRFIDTAEDLDLFALRAMAAQPMHRLAKVSDDPAGAWRRGDPEVVRELALLELRDAGLTPPP
jgi:hypothetical protein